MRQRPVGLSVLRRVAPDAARNGVLYAVPPERIEFAPWLVIPNAASSTNDELVAAIWSYGMTEPLVGRATGPDHYHLIAEPEFLVAARTVGLTTVRLYAVDIEDALGRAIAIASGLRRANGAADEATSFRALAAVLAEAGLTPTSHLLADLTAQDERRVAALVAGTVPRG